MKAYIVDASVVVKWFNQANEVHTFVRSAFAWLDSFPIEFIKTTPALFENAAVFAQRYDISVYDANDAAIASELGGTLMTANPRSQARVREAFGMPLQTYLSAKDVDLTEDV